MAVTSTAQACDLVIFGAKGDLARRKLLPSLYQLEKAGHIHPDTRIIGVGRAEWDKKAYTEVVKEALGTFMKEKLPPSTISPCRQAPLAPSAKGWAKPS